MGNRILRKVRERLRENPNDDLKDIEEEMQKENRAIEQRCRDNILRTWFIGGLFNYDYEAAKIALVKCITLDPAKSISVDEANKLLPVLWQSCRILFKDDFSTLFDEIERALEINKAFDDEDNLPFV